MRKKPKTNADLIEEGVLEERIISTWLKAKVWVEECKRRTLCRICGQPIEKGRSRVVSDDWRLISLYSAFWSDKIYAHKECYEKLTLPRGLSDRSFYRKRRYCPRCDTWVEIYNGANGNETWPRKSDNNTRCPFCGTLLRLKPRRLPNAPRVIADLKDLKVVPVKGRQLTLDDFTGRLVWVKRGDKLELYEVG